MSSSETESDSAIDPSPRASLSIFTKKRRRSPNETLGGSASGGGGARPFAKTKENSVIAPPIQSVRSGTYGHVFEEPAPTPLPRVLPRPPPNPSSRTPAERLKVPPPPPKLRNQSQAKPFVPPPADEFGLGALARLAVGPKLSVEQDDGMDQDDTNGRLKGDGGAAAEKPILKYAMVKGPKVSYPLDGEDGKYSINAPLNQYLKEYQREGVDFLFQRWKVGMGGVLGDDMGLGKTIQVIAFLTSIFHKTNTSADLATRAHHKRLVRAGTMDSSDLLRVLIVCPNAVLYNWKDEIERWAYFKVEVFHGVKKEEALNNVKSGTGEILITSFDTLKVRSLFLCSPGAFDDVNSVHCLFQPPPPSYHASQPQAHRLKEPKTRLTAVMKALNDDRPFFFDTNGARRRFGLTGTPFMNDYSEMWCLLDWAVPGCVGRIEDFNRLVSAPLKRGQKHSATVLELAEARATALKFNETIVRRWMLRRTKNVIRDQLPKKEDVIVMCPVTKTMMKAYNCMLDSEDFQLLLTKDDFCDCERNAPDPGNTEKQLKSRIEWTKLAFPDSYKSKKGNFENWSSFENCGKWKVLRGERSDSNRVIFVDGLRMIVARKVLLVEWKKQGAKVLLFSFRRELLNMLEQCASISGLWLKVRHDYAKIDGTVPADRRLSICKEFNTDPNKFILLISTTAGGVGLNLAGANIVVVFDPNFNPALDLQAQDRAFRIGQTRNASIIYIYPLYFSSYVVVNQVTVLRLFSAGTLEEMIYNRQVYKQQHSNIAYEAATERRLFEAVQGDPGHQGELFGIKVSCWWFEHRKFNFSDIFSLQNLLSYLTDNDVTKTIVQKTERAEAEYAAINEELADAKEEDLDSKEDAYVAGFLEADLKDASATDMFKKMERVQEKANRDAINALLWQFDTKTHHHGNVLGESTLEAEISRDALAAVASGDVDDQELAYTAGRRKRARMNVAGEEPGAALKRVPTIGETPTDEADRQLALMAEYFGMELETFAEKVNAAQTHEIRKILDRWYRVYHN
ncbi:hypothetical protein HDU93_003258 [Gonapodya sp. JEL0774]|nr:hypothetical protein HDU93_003258 [Gonapodya sp. JEL0774]